MIILNFSPKQLLYLQAKENQYHTGGTAHHGDDYDDDCHCSDDDDDYDAVMITMATVHH